MGRNSTKAPTAGATILSGLIAAGATAAGAAENDWYVRVNAGVTLVGDDSGAFTDGTGTRGADASFDAGFASGIAVGLWLNERWRVDADWTYRSNDNDEIVLADGRVVGGGNFASTALSLNGFYHFSDPAVPGSFSPFVGAGIAWVNEIDIDLEGGGLGDGVEIEDLEDDGVGIQLMAGFSYRQSERLRWDAELRWLYFGETELDGDRGNRLADVDYTPLGVFAGFSYGF